MRADKVSGPGVDLNSCSRGADGPPAPSLPHVFPPLLPHIFLHTYLSIYYFSTLILFFPSPCLLICHDCHCHHFTVLSTYYVLGMVPYIDTHYPLDLYNSPKTEGTIAAVLQMGKLRLRVAALAQCPCSASFASFATPTAQPLEGSLVRSHHRARNYILHPLCCTQSTARRSLALTIPETYYNAEKQSYTTVG